MRDVNWHNISRVIVLWEGIVVVAATVMLGGIMGFMRNNLPPQIPLFYSLPWGEEQLAAPWNMVWGLGVIWMAWILSWLKVKSNKEPILSTFVSGAGLISQLIIMLGLVRIILIIG